MTETEARKLYVDTAKSFLGYSEASGKHRQIIDIYNAKTPLPRNYKVTYSDAWCATFVSAMAIKCGMANIIPRECSCYYQVEQFRKMERWQENDGYTPKPGDIIYYDWQDSGNGDNQGVPDHVGIVETVSEGSIVVIEGNYHDTVDKRYIRVNGKNIRGYGLPNFAWWAKEHTPKPKEEPWYIKDGTWQKAKELGIMDGTRPDERPTRAELAAVALRVLKLAKEDK